MQRKNYLLRTSQIKKTSKNGMAMMMAIIVLVVIATVMALSLSLATQTSKRTTDLYLYEQSILLSHSAAEYALLKISQVDPCKLKDLNFKHNDIYDINVSLHYVYTAPSPCTTAAVPHGVDYFNTSHAETNGTVLMDITVTANPAGTTEPIRYFRRSLQKL
ncbi:hypothetical protein [Sulfurimonas sp.]|uniref:hypothetical protein n=1 Tax=Sulfurimonas sp. TaxID=2022749 RepID=UPI002B4846C3|nr:hypothetical protein [Sulfurimonas sp.]